MQLGITQDFSAYERVVYLDVDLLLLAPLAPYLIASQDSIQFETTRFTLKPHPNFEDYYGWDLIEKNLSKKEQEGLAKVKGFNTSLISAERELFVKFCKEWWALRNLERLNRQKHEEDQPIANWLVFGEKRFKGFSIPMPWLNLKGQKKRNPKYWQT